MNCLKCHRELVNTQGNPYWTYGLGPICGANTVGNQQPDSFKTFEHKDFASDTKRFHYNPASSLGRFSLNPIIGDLRESKVGFLDLKTGELNKERKTDKIGFDYDIYGFNSYHQATNPAFIEDEIMTPIDNAYNRLYDDLVSNKGLTREQKSDLIVFLLSLRFRNPKFLDKVQVGLKEEFAKYKNTGATKYSDEEQKTLGELSNSIFLKNYENKLFLHYMIEDTYMFAFFDSMTYKVVDNDSGVNFCIGDNPMVSMTSHGYNLGDGEHPVINTGFICLPIAKDKMLVLSCLNKIPDKISDPKIVHQFNSFQLKQSEKWFLMPQALGGNKDQVLNHPDLSLNKEQDMDEINLFLRDKQSFNTELNQKLSVVSKVIRFRYSSFGHETYQNNKAIFKDIENVHRNVRTKYFQAINLYNKESSIEHILRSYDIKNGTNVKDKMTIEDLSKIEKEISLVKKRY